MKVQISGLRAGERWPKRGEVVEFDDREGAKLCANGYAEPVAEPQVTKAEKAVAPERASKRSTGKRSK